MIGYWRIMIGLVFVGVSVLDSHWVCIGYVFLAWEFSGWFISEAFWVYTHSSDGRAS